MRSVAEGTISLAVTRKPNSNGYCKVIKRDVHKLSFLLRPNSFLCVVFSNFPVFFNFIFLVKMASGRSREIFDTSDSEEEVFAGFTMEEIAQFCEERQRRRQQQNSSSSEQNFDDSSDLELFFDEEDEEYHDESSDEEAGVANQAQVPQNAVNWSPTLQDINIADFSLRHGPTKDLGENATSKDYFYQFLDDAYLEEIVRCSVAYARSKGDNNFTTNRSEISAFLGLNILMGIHDLPQIQMYWDSDEFIGVEGFKKTIPKQSFNELFRQKGLGFYVVWTLGEPYLDNHRHFF